MSGHATAPRTAAGASRACGGEAAGIAGTAGTAAPAWPFPTAARFTSLILRPSRSSSNSTKLEASMYSISSLISLSKRPPPIRDLRGPGAARDTPAPMDALDSPHHNPMRPQIQRRASRLPESLLELQPRPPDFVTRAPQEALRPGDHAQIVVAADRPQDGQTRPAGDRDLFRTARRRHRPQRGRRPLHQADPLGGRQVDVERRLGRHLLDRNAVEADHRGAHHLGHTVQDLLKDGLHRGSAPFEAEAPMFASHRSRRRMASRRGPLTSFARISGEAAIGRSAARGRAPPDSARGAAADPPTRRPAGALPCASSFSRRAALWFSGSTRSMPRYTSIALSTRPWRRYSSARVLVCSASSFVSPSSCRRGSGQGKPARPASPAAGSLAGAKEVTPRSSGRKSGDGSEEGRVPTPGRNGGGALAGVTWGAGTAAAARTGAGAAGAFSAGAKAAEGGAPGAALRSIRGGNAAGGAAWGETGPWLCVSWRSAATSLSFG